jgi:NAD(P)-dependent dehydrogenase (short-subunit alcohol dehydrogenase family)
MASTSDAVNPPLSTDHLNVTNRVFVITGGTRGLGLAIARLLKARGAAGLVLISRSKDKGRAACKELEGSSCTCAWVHADLSLADDASTVIPRAAQLMKDVGPISGVVNAAAITTRGNLLTTTAESFDLQMAVNVRAPFLVTQAAAKHMIEQKVKSGSIVNICSVAAHGGAPFVMSYSVAKAALVTLTKNNAAQLAPNQIRVNGINMGWCQTDNEDALQIEQSGSEWVQQADATVPLGRILRPQDVAATIDFLLSGASTMMTGTIMELHPEYAEGMLSLSVDEGER